MYEILDDLFESSLVLCRFLIWMTLKTRTITNDDFHVYLHATVILLSTYDVTCIILLS